MPSSVVGDCVNVISGDFVDHEEDITIPGHEPFILSRSYTSSDYFMQSLCNGWSLNHTSIAFIDKELDRYSINLRRGGSILHYEAKHKNVFKNVNRGFLDKSQWRKGLTNCAEGFPSAKTNLNNDYCDLDYLNKKLTFRRANGDKYCYCGDDLDKLYLWGIEKANTLKYLYLYNEKRLINSIVLRNKNNTPLATLSFDLQKDHASVITPGNRKIVWHFDAIKNGGLHCPILSKVERETAPNITYENERYMAPWGRHVVRVKGKYYPDDRFTEIDYYGKGDYKFDNIKNMNDYRYARVMQIKRPLGETADPIVAYTFKYNAYSHKDAKERGYTEVRDALKRRMVYHYDNARLEKIEHFLGHNPRLEGDLYRTQNIFWAPRGTFYVDGHLIGTGISDNKGFYKGYTQYIYDAQGNVKKSKFMGNLTGVNFLEISLDENGIPIESGSDVYFQKFQYSSEGLNNLVLEDNGRFTTHYEYLDNTALCTAKYVFANGDCKNWNGYSYDQNACLIKEVIEQGEAINKGQISRRITKLITPRESYPVGLPSEIYVSAHDFATGEEKMLSKVCNVYEGDGFLTHQDFYDCHYNLAYSKSYTYDKQGNLTSETDPYGNVTRKEYDANQNLIKEEGPLSCKKFTYDFCNRLIKEEEITEDGSLSKNYYYDLAGQKIGETDVFGNRTDFTYDDLGRLIKQELPAIIDDKGNSFRPTTTFEYDILDCVTKTIDPLGSEITTAYTARKTPYNKQFSDGTFEKVRYHVDGTILESIDRLGNKTVIESDYLKRPVKTSVYDSQGNLLNTTSKAYSFFDVTSETDEKGITTSYEYDFAGRLSEKRRLDFHEIYQYDSLGRLYKTITKTNDRDAIVKVTLRDLLDRIIEERVEDLQGHIQSRIVSKYDALGRKTHVQTFGENGAETTETVYNRKGDIVAVINAEGKVTRTDYDYHYRNSLGQKVLRVTLTDPMGLKTRIEKDAIGNESVIEQISPLGELLHKKTHFYNGNGQKIKTIEESFTPTNKTQILEKKYDNQGRLIEVIEAANSPNEKSTKLFYNKFGQKCTIIKPSGIKLCYEYDALGRLSRIFSSDETIDYNYEYDVSGNPIAIHDAIKNKTTFRKYDESDQLIEERLANELSIGFVYDSAGQLTLLTFPDQTAVEYEYQGSLLKKIIRKSETPYEFTCDRYDESSRILEATLPGKAGKLIQTFDLMGRTTSIISEPWQEQIEAFDDIGNLLSRKIQDKCGLYQESFSYDDLYQLKSEAGLKDHQYSYDTLFNRVEEDGGVIEVNELNQITTKNKAAYEYDLDGHLIALTHNNSRKEFKYDALDRLIFYKDEKGSAEYSYDFSHRRLGKKIFDSEGNIILEEKYLYLENKEIGSLTPENRFISFRVLLPNIASENRASIAVELLGKPYAAIHDHNGSIVSLTDIETGEAIHQARFNAFGCLIEKNTSLAMPWGFSGKRFDEETGFIFFGRRYYHPEDGRWITKDPLGEFDGPNLYAYVQNRPSILIDAYGYMAEDSSLKHATYGIGLGAFDFMVNMFHDLERGAAYYGSSDLEMSFDDRSIMLGSVAEAQANRMNRLDDFLADKLSFDKTDPLFQSCRAYTTLTMEVGSLALGGYNIAVGGYRSIKGIAASRGFFQKSTRASKYLLRNSTKAVERTLHLNNKTSFNQLNAQNNTWKFPENPNNFLKDLPRDMKGRVYPCDNLCIRIEKHPFDVGDTFNPRHHGWHYHLETRINPMKPWNWQKNKNIHIIKPNDYYNGMGTGFIPGEMFPGL